jgi:hypothetical protein
MWSICSPSLAVPSWNCLCLETSVILAVSSRTLFKIPVIGITTPILNHSGAISQCNLVVWLPVSLPMIDIKSIAWFIANLECIAIEIIITCWLAFFNSDPIVFSATLLYASIINTHTNLLSIVVCKLTKDTVISWEFVKIRSWSRWYKIKTWICLIAAFT